MCAGLMRTDSRCRNLNRRHAATPQETRRTITRPCPSHFAQVEKGMVPEYGTQCPCRSVPYTRPTYLVTLIEAKAARRIGKAELSKGVGQLTAIDLMTGPHVRVLCETSHEDRLFMTVDIEVIGDGRESDLGADSRRQSPQRVPAATSDGAERLPGYFAAARDCSARRANGASPRRRREPGSGRARALGVDSARRPMGTRTAGQWRTWPWSGFHYGATGHGRKKP